MDTRSASSSNPDPLSSLVSRAEAGDEQARTVLVDALYDRLRAMANVFLQNERANHTLQPTALVNEAWMRLAKSENLDQCSKTTFLAAAATTFRRLLIDYARQRIADKRGGGAPQVELTDAEAASPRTVTDVLTLDGVLEELSKAYPRQHRVVEMKYFADMTTKQIAEVLSVSERTVANDWDFARVWLRTRLGDDCIAP